ncbi:MAG: hypothetical protein V3T05_02780 [Myxococcota bacterium]
MQATLPESSWDATRTAARRPWIALVGPKDQENLGLRYLVGSLNAAGLSAHVIPRSHKDTFAGSEPARILRPEPGVGSSPWAQHHRGRGCAWEILDVERATVDEVAALYKKAGFLIWRRLDGEPSERQERLRDIVCRWLSMPSRTKQTGSQLAGVYHLALGAPITEQRPADGADALPDGRCVDDLAIERFLLGDLPPDEHQRVGGAIAESSEDRGRMDSLLKQRLIFLADNRPDAFARAVADQQAFDAAKPPPRPRRSLRWFAVPAAGAAAICLTTVAVWTQAGSSPRSAPERIEPTPMLDTAPAAAREADVEAAPFPETVIEDVAEPEPVDAMTDETVTDPIAEPAAAATFPKRTTRSDNDASGVRLIVYARSAENARLLEDGDTLAADEKIVAWIKTDQVGYAAVIGRRGRRRARIHFSDDREAIAVPAGGPTRLGNARALRPAGDTVSETLCLLYAAEPFSVRPIAQRIRAGVELDAAFDGITRCLSVETTAATP